MVVKGIRFDLSDYKERKEKQDKECAKTLDRFKKLCTNHDIKFLVEIIGGDPREVIIDSANRHKANYIAIGSRGLAGIKSLLMGSVSSYIVEQSNVPVLVVK
jgi:nucleotide-binding universal stress UspA family protein